MIAAKSAVTPPIHGDQRHGASGDGAKSEVRARDHVDAGRDHRRGVDEGGDGRRAFHRVRQPDVQRELRALAGRAEQEQQADHV